jgi:hypothetical protein
MSDFNWNDEDCVVFETMQGIAVYGNDCGQILIRQEGYNGNDDVVIFIPLNMAARVAKAIVDCSTNDD